MYDGKKTFSWFNNNPKDLYKHILRRKYDGYTIYAHNLSLFDIVFLFKYLPELKLLGFTVQIIKKENKYIYIKIYNNKKNISITLRDSYLLLPSSLSKLSTQFRVSTGHGTGQLSGAVQWAVIRH